MSLTHPPTAEQAAIIDAYRTGGDLVVEAGAGTGKTSTLRMLAGADPRRRAVYLAYNKSVARDADRSFPTTVACRTAHSLAYAAVGYQYRHRLDAPRLRARDVAVALRITDPLAVGDVFLSPVQLARLAQAAVGRFCYSRDAEIGAAHVPTPANITTPGDRAAVRAAVAPYARRAWDDVRHTTGALRVTHDVYLKLWQLSGPVLPVDVVYLDEAQDANPAVAAIVEAQTGQRIMVGDRCQSIYGWRGAVDAMARFSADHRLMLSRSWRFGQPIADEANKWLSILDSPLRLTGNPSMSSTVGPVDRPDAVLCRSNARTLVAVLRAYEAGQRPALVGGGRDLRRLADAAIELRAGHGCSHPELVGFDTWADVVDYATDDDGSDLAASIKIIDQWTPEAVVRLLRGLLPEDRADVVISTAHKAKGSEWSRVVIADDFAEPKVSEDDPDPRIPPADAMLAYVAVTRGRERLDRSGLAWVDKWLPAQVAA